MKNGQFSEIKLYFNKIMLWKLSVLPYRNNCRTIWDGGCRNPLLLFEDWTFFLFSPRLFIVLNNRLYWMKGKRSRRRLFPLSYPLTTFGAVKWIRAKVWIFGAVVRWGTSWKTKASVVHSTLLMLQLYIEGSFMTCSPQSNPKYTRIATPSIIDADSPLCCLCTTGTFKFSFVLMPMEDIVNGGSDTNGRLI